MAAGPPLEATVVHVQRFSLHDGPGVRTTVFFKGCPLRCRWCQNPETLRREPEIAFYADRCRETGECLEACPRGALAAGSERVARDLCDGCGLCAPRCAFGALELVGRTVGVEALLAEVARDRPFYEASGGGVTLSGGEPTLQLPFALAFARRCREEGLTVALQTCGAFRWPDFEPLLELLELVHFDLEVIDPEAHRRATGAGNRVILESARRLVAAGAPVVFRTPVVPGWTDGEANVRAIAALLRELGVVALHLLPYHRMGEVKGARVGRPQPPLEPEPPLQIDGSVPIGERVAQVAALLREEGITPALEATA